MRLGVNIDHVATVRELRGTPYPDLVLAAKLVAAGGADQLTFHLREDRRHVKDDDVWRLREETTLPIDFEMAATEEMVDIACRLKPAVATLVPERRQEVTTERGVDVVTHRQALQTAVKKLLSHGVQVSLFIDPLVEHVQLAADIGAAAVELHTGTYAVAAPENEETELRRLCAAAQAATALGLQVAAGHGLHYENTPLLRQRIPEIMEYNIGHAIVARALFKGLEEAVREMKALLQGRGKR